MERCNSYLELTKADLKTVEYYSECDNIAPLNSILPTKNIKEQFKNFIDINKKSILDWLLIMYIISNRKDVGLK